MEQHATERHIREELRVAARQAQHRGPRGLQPQCGDRRAPARMDVRDVRADVAELAQAHGGAWAEAERLDRALHEAARRAIEARFATAVASLAERSSEELGRGSSSTSLGQAAPLAVAMIEGECARIQALARVPLALPESV